MLCRSYGPLVFLSRWWHFLLLQRQTALIFQESVFFVIWWNWCVDGLRVTWAKLWQLSLTWYRKITKTDVRKNVSPKHHYFKRVNIWVIWISMSFTNLALYISYSLCLLFQIVDYIQDYFWESSCLKEQRANLVGMYWKKGSPNILSSTRADTPFVFTPR